MFCIVYCKCACAMGTIMFQLKGLNRLHHQPSLPLTTTLALFITYTIRAQRCRRICLNIWSIIKSFCDPIHRIFVGFYFAQLMHGTILFYPFSTFCSVRQFLNFNFLPTGIFVRQIKQNFTCFHFRKYFATHLNNLSA